MHTSAPPKSKTEIPSTQERKTASLNGISDNRPEAQQLASLSGIAARSPQLAQLQAFQQMAGAYTQANQYVPDLKKQDAGEGVVQGVFVYSYEYQAIQAANKDAAYYQGLGFESQLSADGHEVWTDARNKQEVAQTPVDADTWWRQFRIASNKLRAGTANVYEHEIRDEDGGFKFRQNNVSYPEAFIIQPKGVGKTGTLFGAGNIFCSEKGDVADPGWIKEISPADANAYWETAPDEGKEEGSPQGDYSVAKGYTRLEYSAPDDRYNCAAYAKGNDTVWIEPEAMHQQLADAGQYEKLDSHTDMQIGVNYIVAKSFHFWRAKKTGADRYEISEKNGPSAIYKRTMTAEQWADTMDETIRGIYRKK